MFRSATLVLAAVLLALAALLSPVIAGENLMLHGDEAWSLSLYGAEGEPGALPGGGLALNLRFDGLPDATVAIDYGDGREHGEGLGLLATLDLIGGGADNDRFLRLSYRAGDSSMAFGEAGDDGLDQSIALRAGLRW